MGANDFFKSIGFDDWSQSMNLENEQHAKDYSNITIGNTRLFKSASYCIEAKDSDTPDNVINRFNMNKDNAIWFNLNSNCESPNSIYSLLAENIEVIKSFIIDVQSEFDTIFISPASSLRSPASNIRSHNTLAFALERLNVWVSNVDTPNITIILVDYDMAEGKSDARNIIKRFVLGKL